MPGPSPGGSPEREAGAGGRPRGPGQDRRVRFRLPHTAIAVPSVREEEQLFYRRLEALAVPGPGGFGPLFASDGWSDLTGERRRAGSGPAGPAAQARTAGTGETRAGSANFGTPGSAVSASSRAEDRLLRKRVVRAGPGGPRPLPGQEVSVKVLGALEDGGLVERDPRLIFVPGHGDVVQALELGVPTMQPGEVSFFLAAFPYAYGRPGRRDGRGQEEPSQWGRQSRAPARAGVAGSRRCTSREPDVPPEAPLLFEVTLLEVRDGPDPQPLPPAVRLRLGSQRRERGNFHFARGDFAAALRSYRLSLRALDGPTAAPPGPEEEEELREQRVKCLNNCAAAELKLGRAEEALAACEAALRICPDNGRALLRRGQLLAEQGRDAEAALVLKRALELDPASKVIHTELSRLAKRQSPPSSTGPQNSRHDPMPPPSPAAPAPPSAEGAI
ncbi:peptidyl-prolyl cis-trans isomerase FKBP8-like [Passerculus sandwichensis]